MVVGSFLCALEKNKISVCFIQSTSEFEVINIYFGSYFGSAQIFSKSDYV